MAALSFREYTDMVTPSHHCPLITFVAVQVPAHTVAALSFRGHVRNRTIVEAKKQQLLDIMKVCGCTCCLHWLCLCVYCG